MTLDRRNLLLGAGAVALGSALPRTAIASTSVERRFDILRKSSKLGTQRLRVSRAGDQLEVLVDIKIDVRLLGLPLYKYTMSNREVWSRGRLVSMVSDTNDNGTKEYVRAERSTGGISVKGSGYEGVISGTPATTTYWTKAFLKRPVWINTQNGEPMNVPVRKRGAEAFPFRTGQISANRYDCRGDLDTLDLFYDANDEWIGNQFIARGETARFVTSSFGGAMAPLWG